MLPMKVRARFRIHDTSGCSIGRGAEEEVRPETRVLGPRERDMKDDAKSGGTRYGSQRLWERRN
jgi:hypothetical protein